MTALNYDKPDGYPIEGLEAYLRQIYNSYPEYSDPLYGGGNFMAMVHKFANDDFYKGHFMARRYLELLGNTHNDRGN